MKMNNLISKLDQILSDVASCRLDYQPIEFIHPDDWEEVDLERLMSSAPRSVKYVRGKGPDLLGVPVYMHSKLTGLAIVRGSSAGAPVNPVPIAELLSTLIELRLSTESHSNALVSFEERLRVQEGMSGNVIPLRPTRLSQVRQWRSLLDEAEAKERAGCAEKVRVEARSLLIDDASAEEARRTALEHHERSGRWAFLSITDLAPETFESPANLEALGEVTVFIEDLASVPASHQARLAELLSSSSDGPSTIVVAALRAEDRHKVMPALLERFQPLERQISDFGDHFIPFNVHLLDPDQAPVQ